MRLPTVAAIVYLGAMVADMHRGAGVRVIPCSSPGCRGRAEFQETLGAFHCWTCNQRTEVSRLPADSTRRPGRGFVGREAELSVLIGAFHAARAGTPQLVTVEGDPGIGKSSLMSEFYRQLASPPHDVHGYWPQDVHTLTELSREDPALRSRRSGQRMPFLWLASQGGGSGSASPLSLWVEALRGATNVPFEIDGRARGAALALGEGLLDVALDAVGVGLLKTILETGFKVGQAIRGRRESAPSAAPVGARLAEALQKDVLGAVTWFCLRPDVPVVIVSLDDLQWADAESVAVLMQLLRGASRLKLLVLAGWRGREMADRGLGAELLATTTRYAADGVFAHRHLRLAPLDGATAGACLRHHLPELAEATAAWAFEEFGGNPFYLSQVAAMLRERALVESTGRQAPEVTVDSLRQLVRGGALPRGVDAILGERLQRLPDSHRTLLASATVQGFRFTDVYLAAASAALHSGIPLSIGAVRHLLQELESVHGLVVSGPSTNNGAWHYEFVDRLVLSVCSSRLTAPVKDSCRAALRKCLSEEHASAGGKSAPIDRFGRLGRLIEFTGFPSTSDGGDEDEMQMAVDLRDEHAELAGQLGLPPDRLPWVRELEQFVADPAVPGVLRAEADELFGSIGNLHFQRDELDLAQACFSRIISAWAGIPLATRRNRIISSSAQQFAWSRLGAVETERGRHVAAEECYQKAVVAALDLSRFSQDDDVLARNILLESYQGLAESMIARGSLDSARELVAAGAALLARAEAPSADEAMEFVTNLIVQASLDTDLEDWPASVHHLERAFACLLALDVSSDPETIETRASAYLTIGLTAEVSGAVGLAESGRATAIALSRSLVEGRLRELSDEAAADAYESLALACGSAGLRHEVHRWLHDALLLRRRIATTTGTRVARNDLAACLENLAGEMLDEDEPKEVRQALLLVREATAIRREFFVAMGHGGAGLALAKSLLLDARGCAVAKKPDQARISWSEAARLVDAVPDAMEMQGSLAHECDVIAELMESADRLAEAKRWYLRALPIREKLAEKTGTAESSEELADLLECLAGTEDELSNGLPFLQRALPLRRALEARGQDVRGHRARSLSHTLWQIGQHEFGLERHSAGHAFNLEAMDVLERARARLPVDDEELHGYEAELLWQIGFHAAEHGPTPEARLALLRALAIVTRLPTSQREDLLFTAKDIRATLRDLEEEN